MANVNVRLNRPAILSKIEAREKEMIKNLGRKEVVKAARAAQDAMLNFFDSHPVTRELKGGASGNNISNTIGGNGNLFSFIGFTKGSDPTVPLRNILEQPFDIVFLGALKRGRQAADFRYRVGVPSLNFKAQDLISRIEKSTPIPWSPGESWATGLKEGISGIGQYLYVETTASRAGKGIQNPKVNLSKTFNNKDYVGEIFESFVRALNGRTIR